RVETQSEILGRNTWMMWAAGNEGFWDWLGRQFGILDFVSLLDSNQRSDRFERAGLVNEPEMRSPVHDDANVIERELGLRLDEPIDPEVRAWRRRYVRMALGLDGGAAAKSYAEEYGGSVSVLPGAAARYPNGQSYDPKIPPPEIYGLS